MAEIFTTVTNEENKLKVSLTTISPRLQENPLNTNNHPEDPDWLRLYKEASMSSFLFWYST